MRSLPDQTGIKYNHLLVTEDLGSVWVEGSKRNRRLVKAFCTNCESGIKVYDIQQLRGNKTVSCGCIKVEKLIKRTKTHGMRNTRFYNCYHNMISRCTNEKHSQYKYYGGRGIIVCESWLNSFENFKEDMFDSYNDTLELDRVDISGGYCRENCRWVDLSTQAVNKRSLVNSSGRVGVCFHKATGKWQVSITKDGVTYYLGIYDNFELAVEVRTKAELEFFGFNKGGEQWLV